MSGIKISWTLFVNFLLFCNILLILIQIYESDLKTERTLMMFRLSTMLFLIGGASSTLSGNKI